MINTDNIFTSGGIKSREEGKFHPLFWKKQVMEAFESDPYKLIIELIKNAADSYIRLNSIDGIQPPFDIFVEIDDRIKNSPPLISVRDNAEGMSSKELDTALEYSTTTSLSDKNSLTSAEKGVGLKDALMAMRLFGGYNIIIVTIKDNKISTALKDSDFATIWFKKDDPISQEERKQSKIIKNGTVIYGILPKFFIDRKFDTIAGKLSRHFLLRKLLQIKNFRIHLIDNYYKSEIILDYKPPKIESQIIGEDFYIDYKNERYSAHIKIYQAKENLVSKRPFGQTGLLIYSGLYSVLDLSLGNYENDSRLSNIFGEVQLNIHGLEQKIRKGEESPLVDNKRHGLSRDNEFNLKLLEQINDYLNKVIQKKEEGEEYSLENSKILKEINKTIREISELGNKHLPPISPKYFELYPNYKEIKEYDLDTIYLVINAMEIQSGTVIKLKSIGANLDISPTEITVEAGENLIVKQIKVYSEVLGLQTEIFAESNSNNHTSKAKIVVVKNPIFSPNYGFSFVPNSINIVEQGNKSTILAIKKDSIANDKIEFEATGPISCPGIISLPKKDLEAKLTKGVLVEKVAIDAKKAKAGEHGTVIARCGEKTSELKINIIKEPSIGGLIRDVKFSRDKTSNQPPARFDEQTGILTLYYHHPIFGKFLQKKLNFRNSDFLTLASEILAHETLKATLIVAIKNNSPKFPVSRPSEELTLNDYDFYFNQIYYEKVTKFQQYYTKLIKSSKQPVI